MKQMEMDDQRWKLNLEFMKQLQIVYDAYIMKEAFVSSAAKEVSKTAR